MAASKAALRCLCRALRLDLNRRHVQRLLSLVHGQLGVVQGPVGARLTACLPPPAGPSEEDGALSGVDYHSLARQHVLAEPTALAPVKHRPLAIRAASTIFQARRAGGRACRHPRRGLWAGSILTWTESAWPGLCTVCCSTARSAMHCCSSKPCTRPPTPLQYMVGLIVGAFQAVMVLFYQWVVDPAEHGTW